MRSALVVLGESSFANLSLRREVVRIPEVSIRLKSAQAVLDSMAALKIDMLHQLNLDDATYARNKTMASFCSIILQVGLMDRWLKKNPQTDLIMAESGHEEILLLSSLKMDFAQWIREVAPGTLQSPAPMATVSRLPNANGGFALPVGMNRAAQIQAREARTVWVGASVGQPERLRTEELGLAELLPVLRNEFQIDQATIIGPLEPQSFARIKHSAPLGLELSESIDSDPFLSWFWNPGFERAMAH